MPLTPTMLQINIPLPWGVMMPEELDNRQFDLIVIGGGTAGCTLARDAADAGITTALVEGADNGLGGTAVHETTLPLRYSMAEQLEWDKNIVAPASPEECNQNLQRALTDSGVVLIKAWGWIATPGEVVMRSTQTNMTKGMLRGQSIAIATGTMPTMAADFTTENSKFVILPNALDSISTDYKKTIIVYGCGTTAVETAMLLNSRGHRVILCTEADTILPDAPAIIRNIAKVTLDQFGTNICTRILSIAAIEEINDTILIDLTNDCRIETITAHYIVDCAERHCVTNNLWADKIDIRTEGVDGHIKVDALCRTNIKGIFAVGSVTNATMTTDSARRAGSALAAFLYGNTQECHSIGEKRLIHTLWLNEPMAWVGLDLQQANLSGYTNAAEGMVRLSKDFHIPMRSGLLSVVVDRQNGEILGAYALGFYAESLIRIIHSLMHFDVTAFMITENSWDPAISTAIRNAMNRRQPPQ